MQQTFTLALPSAVTDAACIAASKRGMVLPDGSGSAAIKVDNRSGFWLAVYPAGGQPIAPYTLGAVVAFVTPAPSVDALFMATGPAGQPATLAGDTVTVTIFDTADAPPADPGVPFVASSTNTPLLTVEQLRAPTIGGALTTALAAIAGKRYRIWSAVMAPLPVKPVSVGGTGLPADSPVSAIYAGGGVSFRLRSDPTQRVDRAVYPEGFDFPLGTAITLTLQSDWANTSGYEMSLNYSVV